MLEIYNEKFTVRTWDVDAKDHLSMAAAFNWCQEIAGIHADKLGVGVDFMREHKVAWILSRMSLELERRPGWQEEIECRTWPSGSERLLVWRNYEMADSKGIFGHGRSAWLILDTEKLRPLRPEKWIEKLPHSDKACALEGACQSIDAQEGLAQVSTRRAAYSDIDYNAHVNNARYIQWIQDLFSLEELATWPRMRCDINYLGQTLEGEEVDLFKGPVGKVWHIEGLQHKTGKPSFRAVFS